MIISKSPSSHFLRDSPTNSFISKHQRSFITILRPHSKRAHRSPSLKLKCAAEDALPTMEEILESSRAQNLDLRLQTLGPFFRITAKSLQTNNEIGRAEGIVRVWVKGKILHLDSMRLKRETLGMEKSIFGIGLFIGAVAIRHGYDCGCSTAELLAINDSEVYHKKLVRFYTRIGFKAVHEVSGETFGDYMHMITWGGVGTRMNAEIGELMVKWCSRFKRNKVNDLSKESLL